MKNSASRQGAFIMLFVAIAGQVLRRGGRLYGCTWFLRLCQWTAPLGFVAVIAGWTTTEVGRQPRTVYGLLHVAQLGLHLDGDPWFGGLHLRGAGWLRPRDRHAAWARVAIGTGDGDERHHIVL
jgi:hypothetical protein